MCHRHCHNLIIHREYIEINFFFNKITIVISSSTFISILVSLNDAQLNKSYCITVAPPAVAAVTVAVASVVTATVVICIINFYHSSIESKSNTQEQLKLILCLICIKSSSIEKQEVFDTLFPVLSYFTITTYH